MAASAACMQVATKVVAPTTVTNTTVGWRRSYMRLEKAKCPLGDQPKAEDVEHHGQHD